MYVCPECGLALITARDLQVHTEIKHADPKPKHEDVYTVLDRIETKHRNTLARAEGAESEVRTILAALKSHCKDDFVVITDGAINWSATIAEFVSFIQLDAKQS